ncbi:MAG: NIPSNAP family protein [Gemmataceae bacterium]|nr:NIPSNAP family protein [Gemmata sp.]MDW8199534.1 NIPSNAP family protein [Gemmataceae bacterium]
MRRMLSRAVLIAAATATITALTTAQDTKPAMVYEMRVYYATPGKLEALHARFRDHTTRLFEKHGLTNVGYFVPVGDNPENKLVYFIAAPSKEARDQAFKNFAADPAWKKVVAESEKDGPLVSKITSRFLTPTDYSPPLKIEKSREERVFELRTYTATKGNLGHLNDRFKNHTLKLFEKHGMTNIVYWNVLKGQKDDDRMLIYLLAHKSPEAAAKSFAAFRQDPAWLAARQASEEKAGGSLTEPQGGVVSEFLKPTDYSPLK